MGEPPKPENGDPNLEIEEEQQEEQEQVGEI